MKTSWDKLMRYAPEREYPLAPLQPDEAARIVEQTMQKAGIKTKKTARPIRAAALAAAIAALLCVSALAAFRLGWFDRLFGGSAALVESKVTAYDETAQYDVTLPSYTEQEQAMIAEGTMQVPEQAEATETGVSARTDEFVFTLDSMLASKDTLYAVLRIEARTQEAEQELAAWKETSFLDRERNGALLVLAQNNTGEGHEREWKNGGMGMDILEVDDGTAYALLTNNGGEFAPGDLILFDMSYHGENFDLFEVPVPEQLEEELTISLDTSRYEGKSYRWDTATITPISFRLDGSGGVGHDETTVTLMLKDGTSFSLTTPGNGAYAPYGTYGALGFSGTGSGEDSRIKDNWRFSRLLDLNELASITVDGVTYPLE